jgi:exonuclease III
MDMRFGTWNVRTIYRAGTLRAVAEEISKYKLDLVGVQEVKWDRWRQTSRPIYIFLWKGE